MSNALVHNEICERLTSDEQIKNSLESIIWFGSIRNKQDVHSKSDCDLQVILDKPQYEVTIKLNTILEDYPQVDLSIMYLQDIYDHQSKVIFHDGTKSLFFIYVLAAGRILYGRNVYSDITDKFTLEDLRPSLLVTMREYLSRLRVMPIQNSSDTLQFKKYSLKLFKDLLVYSGVESFHEMSGINNDIARTKVQSLHEFSSESQGALKQITDYEKNFTKEEMAHLLCDYELIIEKVCND